MSKTILATNDIFIQFQLMNDSQFPLQLNDQTDF